MLTPVHDMPHGSLVRVHNYLKVFLHTRGSALGTDPRVSDGKFWRARAEFSP